MCDQLTECGRERGTRRGQRLGRLMEEPVNENDEMGVGLRECFFDESARIFTNIQRCGARMYSFHEVIPMHGKHTGDALLEDGVVYSGEWEDGKPHGKGRCVWLNEGQTFAGHWKAGIIHGEGDMKFGKHTIRKNASFRGIFVDGKMYSGRYIDADKNIVFEGQFLNGRYHGDHCTYDNGKSKYSGSFRRGRFHGIGELVDEVGWKTRGDFIDGVLHGNGKIVFQSGLEWCGQFIEGKPMVDEYMEHVPLHGVAKLKDRLFAVKLGFYIGSWKDQKPHGRGEYYYTTGNYYVGKFKKGKRSMKGTMHFSTLSVYSGEWKSNFMHGEGHHEYSDGSYYEGSYVNGRRCGYGTWYDATKKIRFVGLFDENEKYTKSGMLTFGSGFVLKAKFKNGKPILPHARDIVPPTGTIGPILVCVSGCLEVGRKKNRHGVSDRARDCDEDEHSTDEDYRFYYGCFLNREYHGPGEIIWCATGRWVKGFFEHGKLVERRE